MDTFSEWLLDQMGVRGWSQSELAKKAGVSRQAISDYVNRKRTNPDERALSAIARAFNLPPEEVFQAAGLLPKRSSRSQLIEAIQYKVSLLPFEKQQEVADYIDFILGRSGKDGSPQEQAVFTDKRGT